MGWVGQISIVKRLSGFLESKLYLHIILTITSFGSDEILYNAKIHPEQYSNTLSDAQVSQLYTSLHYVVSHAVDTLVDWDLFPENWLIKHRWGKGKKNSLNRLANGAEIKYITVGGRTSAVVPSVQKKTGPVAGDVKHEEKAEEDQDGEATEEDEAKQGKTNSKGTDKKKADSKATNGPSTSEKHNVRQDNRVIPSVRKQVASSSKKDEGDQEKPITNPPVRKQVASASKTSESPTKSSRGKRQPSNPSSSVDKTSDARITSTENVPSANKKRARKSEPEEDESAEAHGQTKKSKDEATGDSRLRRRSARISNLGGRSE